MSLTPEDKHWITESFASALTTRLGALEARVDTRLGALEARVDAKLENLAKSFSSELSTKLTASLEAFEVRVDAKLERLETKLLTEFHKWASPQEMRQRTHSAALRAIDIEIETLAERVTNLERPAA